MCHLHFQESSYKQTRIRRKLKDTAVPTLHLPKTELENIAPMIDLLTDTNPAEQKVNIEELFIEHEEMEPAHCIEQPRKKFKRDETESKWKIGQVLRDLQLDTVSQNPLSATQNNLMVEPAERVQSDPQPGPSTSQEHLEPQFNFKLAESTNTEEKWHSKIVKSPVNKQRSLLGKETRSKNLTPKARRLYQIAA